MGKQRGRKAMLQGMEGRDTGDSVARKKNHECVEGKGIGRKRRRGGGCCKGVKGMEK